MDQTLEAPPQAPSQPTPSQSVAQAVSVDIYDQIYNLRGTDPAYIERLAAIVDAKMRAVAALGNTVDSLRVAVLAALNIADELCTARQRHDQIANLAGTLQNSQHSTRSRASTLAHMLDEVLDDRKAG
ncbi:MAG TPA: cell division protein ZapA [Edaphobacter sp.]|nr:cell division protein ZapA [Edaphobacter sp.]